MKFSILTLGCKVNQYESNMMKEKMLSSNFIYTENFKESSIIIVNTCSVTDVSDKKCLKLIRRLKRENENSILVVVGCSSFNNQDLYKSLDIDILLGNKNKSKIDILIKNYIKNKKEIVRFYNTRDLEFEDMSISKFDHVRAFIKIEDGCDNFCSYCIIPYVRGSVRSKNMEKVINEAKVLCENGHKEIVLTGIHTGQYNDDGYDLTDLINELSKIDTLKRIRISSIEITELNDKFLNMLYKNDKVCDHLHIPLQAGSNKILKKMNRKYDLSYFEEKINKIRSIRPDISITTDIIVGFPDETDVDFEDTLNFSKKINFSKIHVFPYSKRIGTPAASMPNQVSEQVKKNRVKKLIELSNSLEDAYYKKFIGKNLSVLIEDVKNNVSIGHTSNYLKVSINKKLNKNEIYDILYGGK